MPISTPTPPTTRISEIDGLRGIAVLLIVVYHWLLQPLAWYPGIDFAYGVDLFFVISGFLIGNILRKIAHRPASLAAFYARRVVRIWPLYYLLLGLVWWVDGPAVFNGIPAWSFGLFIFNFWEAHGHWLAATSLGTLWSLAIEEQFYGLGPLVYTFVNHDKIKQLAGWWICLSPVLRFVILFTLPLDLWRFTPVRLDGILVGLYLASWLANPTALAQLAAQRTRLQWATGGAFLLAALCQQDLFFKLLFGPTLMAIAFGLLLALVLVQHTANQPNRLLNSGLLRYFGVRCYSIYLFHLFFMYLIAPVAPHFLLGLFAQALFTFGFAHLSWHYLEAPLIEWAKRFQY